MKPERTIEILTKLKTIHENNSQLAMNDITNEEIVKALEIGANAVSLFVDLAHMAVEMGDEEDL